MKKLLTIQFFLLLASSLLISCSEKAAIQSALQKKEGNAYPYGVLTVNLEVAAGGQADLVDPTKLPFSKADIIESTLLVSPTKNGIVVDLSQGLLMVSALLVGQQDTFSVEYQINSGMIYRVDYKVDICDFNFDGVVNMKDFELFKEHFNKEITSIYSVHARFDLNGDWKIDGLDFIAFRTAMARYRN